MVRVVSCHHFVSQDVFLSENEPVAFCGAQDKLLVSTTQHAVNIHDLDARGNVLHSFPTVDIVKQILYCESGNYVATIESKASWQSNNVSYVRVYFKWWIDVNSQPLRVRVAGSTSLPSEDHPSMKKQFEMVELPLEKPAIFIASCSKTSALAVSLGNIISVFCFSTKIHPASKQTYHDFDHFVDITTPIFVKQVTICENYFACMSDKAVVVFKVCENDDDNDCSDAVHEDKNSELVDENFVEWRFESCTYSGSKDKVWENHIKEKLHPNSFPINIHLHAIDKANENFSEDHECEFNGPLLTVKGCTVDIRLNSRTFEMFPAISSNIYSVILLFRQFVFKENDGPLKSLQLIPFHELESSKEGFFDPLNAAASESEKCSFSLPWPNITSGHSSLKAMGVFFSTCLEGFLYNITKETQFVDSYVYTSTMKGVFLEASLLHALTDTGLETYTVHLPHSILEQVESVDNVKNIVPKYDSEVCLLGLRPFLGVDHLVKSDNHLVLVSSLEDSVSNSDTEGGNRSTLYSLKEPSPSQVFMDLLEVAECQKVSSPFTYHDLLSEAHMILRAQCFLGPNKEMEVLLKKSCLLLADYYICSDASLKLNAVPYYHLSQLSTELVLKRILEFRLQPKYGNILKPLIAYVNSKIFSESKNVSFPLPQAVADPILSAYADESPEMLWKIVLCSDFTGYKLDKAILLLKRRLTNKKHPLSPISNAADTVALVYLLLLKGTTEAAENVILSVSKTDLLSIITNIPNKLWSGMSLTSFGKFMKQTRPDAFVDLLISYVDKKMYSLSDVIQFLQSESPNTDLHCVPLLREFLEEILKDKSMKNDSAAMALLVKLYLKQLLDSTGKTESGTNSPSIIVCTFSHFFTARSSWLNEMPPFNGKISRTCALSSPLDGMKNAENKSCSCWNCNENLLRLQSLLSYIGPVEEIKGMVLEFLYSAGNKNLNWLSLEVMCSSEAQAIKMLIGMVPRALLPFAKEIFKADKKKWSLLFSLLNEHINALPEDHPNAETYAKTFQAVLAHLAETLSVEEILRLLPQESNPVFLPHVKRCVERHQADLLRNKIVSLGQEIKLMMHS
ncbi:BLOC-2 complex member HPS3 [Parasteatoda tepidariorum]|uniref:BLOC-2 complex member HPS3 n=1 Tax=Parasteatoda tepidariorum TaxID=114398 RepID=UPI001C7187DE|nr:uncharacterized protein LOC107437050 [Parasteatoda tepidariorum]